MNKFASRQKAFMEQNPETDMPGNIKQLHLLQGLSNLDFSMLSKSAHLDHQTKENICRRCLTLS